MLAMTGVLVCTVAAAAPAAGGRDRSTIGAVTAELETRAVFDDDAGGNADTDDPAIWIHPDDAEDSVVIVTEKEAGLVVFDLDGRVIQEIDAPTPPNPDTDAPGRFNNVDLVYDFDLGGHAVDLAVVSDRGRDQIRIYTIDPEAAEDGRPPLTDVTAADVPFVFSADQAEVNQEETSYGLATWTTDGDAYAFVSRNNRAEIAQARLTAAPGRTVGYDVVGGTALPSQFALPDGSTWTPCGDPGELPQVEGMVVDRERRILYAAQENVAVWRIPLGADAQLGTPSIVDKVREFGVPWSYDAAEEECVVDFASDPGFGGDHISADAEGLIIYYAADGEGYLMSSSQGDNTTAVYDRRGANRYLGSFAVVRGNGIDGVQETDGADVTNIDLGGAFDEGLLVVQDGDNTPTVVDENGEARDNTNVKFVEWDDVAESFDRELLVDTDGADPRG